MDHDDFEILVEMRNHGALDPSDAARLDEHLATCDACRRYDAFGRAGLPRMAWTPPETLKRSTGSGALVPLLVTMIVLGLFASLPAGPTVIVAELVLALVGVPYLVLSTRARLAEAERVAPLLFYRQRLRAKLGREWLLVVFFVLLGAFTLFLAGPHEVSRELEWSFVPTLVWQPYCVVMLLATLGAWGAAAYLVLVSIPRTRREQADLA